MLPRFERFIQERKYLKNVPPRTIEWYEQSLAWLTVEQPRAEDLRSMVVRMREAGLKASSCNCRIRAINGYLHWNAKGADRKCHPACEHLRIAKLMEADYIPATYSANQLTKILAWKPRAKKFYERRLHALILTLFDTGMRDEALSLRVRDCNLDDLLVTVTGKGRKQRILPFSMELRRVLAKFILDFRTKIHDYLFSTKLGRKLSHRNALRAVKAFAGVLASLRQGEQSTPRATPSLPSTCAGAGVSFTCKRRSDTQAWRW